jgi:hypothetical protein
MKTPTQLLPWTRVSLTDGTRDLDATSAQGLQALDEYRRTHAIRGYWPCTVRELEAYGEAHHEDTADAGVAVEAIDWSGFPMTPAEILSALCAVLRLEGVTIVAEGRGARVRLTQPLYGPEGAVSPADRLARCAGACGLRLDPDGSAGAVDDEEEARHVDDLWHPLSVETRPVRLEGSTLVYVDGSRLSLAELPGIDVAWFTPPVEARLSQSSTLGVEGHQYTVGRPGGWFTGRRTRPWYAGPVYEVTEMLSERPALSDVDPEGDATDAEIDALDAAPPTVLDERRSHWSTPEAAEAHAAALRTQGWTATVARLADATDPTEALETAARAVRLPG